jgi:hypothetical protein
VEPIQETRNVLDQVTERGDLGLVKRQGVRVAVSWVIAMASLPGAPPGRD